MTPQETIEALYQQYLADDNSTHPVSLMHAIWNAAIESSAESATWASDKDSILKLLIK